MQRKIRVYIVLGVIITAMAFLMISGFNNETMVYSIKIKELKAKGEAAFEQGFRVSGFVDPITIKKSADMLSVNFIVKEDGDSIPVVYRGILPDTFKPGADGADIEVLVEGKYQRDGAFHATNILTKCASKYDPAEEDATERSYSANSGS